MTIRMPVRRLVASNVQDRVLVEEDELHLSATSIEGEESMALWRADTPHSGFFVTRFAAGITTPFHRPLSTNYMYVIEGEIEYLARNGPAVRLQAGDCFVAREIDHGWRTPPDSHAVVCTVMVYSREGGQATTS